MRTFMMIAVGVFGVMGALCELASMHERAVWYLLLGIYVASVDLWMQKWREGFDDGPT